MTSVIKVDRVKTPDEAAELAQLGVGIIGVDLGPRPIFQDDRCVDLEAAKAVAGAVGSARLCLSSEEAGADIARWRALIEACRPSYVQLPQLPGCDLPDEQFRNQLRGAGVEVIYSGVQASYEDDPSWIFSRFENVENLLAAYYQLELLTDRQDSWVFFRDECPAQEEELQIEDVDQLAAERPILISLDYTPDNVGEIMERFPHARGIAFTLGALSKGRYDLHAQEWSRLIDTLKALPART